MSATPPQPPIPAAGPLAAHPPAASSSADGPRSEAAPAESWPADGPRPEAASAQNLPAFVRANATWLGAGAMMTFGSSFGQTFFIALFAGGIQAEFGLSHGAWGAIYTLGTLGSAVLMLWAGALTDRIRARTLALGLLLLFAGVCAFTAAAWSPVALGIAIFGLRFCGQGMLYHTAIVSMGRWFARARGRAVAMANLGIAAGEAVLPFAFALLIVGLGWRGAWLVAAVMLLALAPLAPLLLRRERTPRGRAEADETPGLGGRHWTRRDALGHWLFWTTLPAFLVAPVFGTAFFFHQVHLTAVKGWDFTTFAALYPLYVLTSIPMMFAGGWAVDRFGVRRLAPVWPAMLACALLVPGLFDGFWAAAVGFALLGAMQGTGAAVSGAWWPEVYGTRSLGGIRAMAASAMVFATAVGPGATGLLIDLGVGFEAQLVGMAAIAAAMSGLFAFASVRAGREAQAPPSPPAPPSSASA